MKLGIKIKTYRENKNLTQVDLANLTGLSRSTIQLYEADKVEIPISNLQKLADALSVEVVDFFDTSKTITTKGDNNISFIGDKNVANLQNFSGANVKNSNFTNANGKDFANLPPILSEFIELYQTYANPQIEKMLQEIIAKLRKIKELF